MKKKRLILLKPKKNETKEEFSKRVTKIFNENDIKINKIKK